MILTHIGFTKDDWPLCCLSNLLEINLSAIVAVIGRWRRQVRKLVDPWISEGAWLCRGSYQRAISTEGESKIESVGSQD